MGKHHNKIKSQKKHKQQKRNFAVEGSDQKVSVLADRMKQQVTIASTPNPIAAQENNLTFVPEVGNFPDSEFYWYIAPKDESGIDDVTTLAVQIMRVLHQSEIELHIEAVLQLYLNLIVCIFPQTQAPLNQLLKQYNFTCVDMDWNAVLEEYDIYIEDIQIDEEQVPKQTVIFAAAGIYLCLIGKQLTSQNYTNWIKSRIRSFTSSCAVENNNPLMNELVPATTHSVSIYTSISARWEIRREIFLFIKASSKALGIQTAMAKCYMILLNGAELGNFSLTNKYIIIENPILLCWQELAKHTPALIAAVDKYQALGEDGPYCKLLYPPQELQESTKYGLRIFAAIARQIAVQEGMDSLKNYAEADTSHNISILITKAMYLVKAAGGANTFTTAGVRNSYLVKEEENKALLEDLGLGAHVTKKGETDSDDSDGENIGVD